MKRGKRGPVTEVTASVLIFNEPLVAWEASLFMVGRAWKWRGRYLYIVLRLGR